MTALSNENLKRRASFNDSGYIERTLETFQYRNQNSFWNPIKNRSLEGSLIVSEFKVTSLLCYNLFSFALGKFQKLSRSIKMKSYTLEMNIYYQPRHLERL